MRTLRISPTRLFYGLGLMSALAACGADHGDVPPVLVGGGPGTPGGGGGGAVAAAYPGPFGTAEGDVAWDLCFELWDDPVAQGFDTAGMKPRCFSDYYDPGGMRHRLLLVNTVASWCTNCAAEFGGSSTRKSLGEEISARRDAGLAVASVLFQDESLEPANSADAVAWAERYQVDFDFGLDSDFGMGIFADPTVQPFNMLVDTRDMRIVLQLEGDQPQVLWATVDSLLADP